MDEVIEKVHKEQVMRNEKLDNELDEYAYSMEELDRIIEEDDQESVICDEKFSIKYKDFEGLFFINYNF